MYLVVFDCDGTIVDSQNIIVAAMERAFAAHDMATPERNAVLSVVGLSLGEAFSVLTDGIDGAPIDALAESYKSSFREIRAMPELHEPLFPGAREAINYFNTRDDVLLGIATGKARRGVDAVFDLHDLHGRFVSIQTADDAPSKPHPGMVLQAMAETGVDADRTVVVGDTSFDMQMARSAGAYAVGVAWGYHPRAHLESAGAHVIVDAYPALVPAVAGLFGWEDAA